MMYCYIVLLGLTLGSISCAPAVGADKSEEKRSVHDCLVHGYRFRNGEVFSIPGFSHCLRYKCQNGGWDVYEEACEVNGQCHRLGTTFSSECVTYRCEKNNNWYQGRRIQTNCKDANGVCRGEYETFPYVINGRRFERCQCLVSGDGYVRYSCGSK